MNDYELSWVPSKLPLEKPFYKSIYQSLYDDILTGVLKPHDQLPSQHELSYFLDIHFTTVTHAYDLGLKNGLLYTEKGRGTFISPNGISDHTIQGKEGVNDLGILNVTSVENSSAEFYVKEAIKNIPVKKLLRYFTNSSLDESYAGATQKWFEYLKIDVSDDMVSLITNGGQNALAIILTALFKPSDTIVVDDFTYSNFIELAKTLHIKLLSISQDDEGMKLDQLEDMLTTHVVAGVYVMPFRSNPTNVAMSITRREKLASLSISHNFLIIEDDYLRYLDVEKTKAIINLAPSHTIYLSSFSKIVAPGIRVALILFDKKFEQKIKHSFTNLNLQEPTLDFEIIKHLINHDFVLKIIDSQMKQIKTSLTLFENIFETKAPLSPFQWVKIDSAINIKQVKERLDKLGIHVLYSPQFQAGGWKSNNDYFIRVSITAINDLVKLEKLLLTIKRTISSS
ncbi:MAG: PLP-dependent aminotransferase family protein [Leuconostoc mesenteroides]|uniref:aminotransferase-like domain-containing protein n=2 Tax=Leuconostoc mesenteroides TaxID=1245 RepID=UPI00235ED554|nr:PLP-dependent aminotransferase family protein [Leuconostoc mesenteroides]MDM7539731.1 PLP-dependent aminotransferase family protein [Leuconostoc mesenteroides]